MNSIQNGTIGILFLLSNPQDIRIGCFDAKEDVAKLRLTHLSHQRIIVHQIQRCLGGIIERTTIPAVPGDKSREQILRQIDFVSDEVVIHDEDFPGIPLSQQGIQFVGNLLDRLRARPTTIQFYDVAKFTVEGTAARVLNVDHQILIKFHQVESRGWRDGYIRLVPLCEDAVWISLTPRFQPQRNDLFAFTHNQRMSPAIKF